jgi:hypothetical protein
VISRRLGRALDWRFGGVVGRLDSLRADAARLQAQIEECNERVAGLVASVEALRQQTAALARGTAAASEQAGEIWEQRTQPLLRTLVDEDAANRRRLYDLRASRGYEDPFRDPDPLVSIAVATMGRALLFDRALPSLLAQTHSNLEVIVVGDAVASEIGERLAALGDPRVRFANLTQRITAHGDPRRHWLVGSTMARNEAARLARGGWLVHFDDDDHLRPDAIASLLELARTRRVEVAYGGVEEHHPDGSQRTLSGFPPRLGSFSWAGALIHGGLRFFERELVAAHLEIPGDMYALERMLRAGARFAALEALVVLDYYPSTLWEPPGDS